MTEEIILDGQCMLEWIGWEPLILNDLKAAERKIQMFYSGVASISTKKSLKEKFVNQQLIKLLKQVTEG